MEFYLSSALWGQAFAVPAVIIDKHLKLCGSTALKVILLILRSPSDFCNLNALCSKLTLDKSDVLDAINYWIEAGILEVASEQKNTDSKQVFDTVKQNSFANSRMGLAESIEQKNTPSPAGKPRTRYPREEVTTLIAKDKALHALVGEAEAILAKPLTSADLDVLTALYSHYGLSPHFIVTLLHYCVSAGKKGMAYTESVAVSWLNDGIDDTTIDTHVELLKKRRSIEGRLRNSFGLDRNFVSREREYIAKWFEQYKIDYALVLHAYEITIARTGKIAFGYMDKILESWRQQGIKTVEQAQKESKPTEKQTVEAGVMSKMIWDKFMEE